LNECASAVRKRLTKSPKIIWADHIDWADIANKVIRIIQPKLFATTARSLDVAADMIKTLMADRFRLHSCRLLAHTADPITGSLEEEYGEAAIDQIEGELCDIVDPMGNGPRPVCRPELVQMIEELQLSINCYIAA
jgi:hypothetical protein